MKQARQTAFRLTDEDRKDIAAVQAFLRSGGYSSSATDAVRFALRYTATGSATGGPLASLRKGKVPA